MAENTLKHLMATMRHRLSVAVDDREAAAMTRVIVEHLKGWDSVGIAIHADDEISDFIRESAYEIVERVVAGEPLQYVIGEARFYGMDFKVTPDVLIPRPDTAALVDFIVDDYGSRSDLSVLDLGTGSGCIAIALARHLPFARVTAIDVSGAAIAIARENAKSLKAKVDFVEADMLAVDMLGRRFDIIVSNPPYIALEEAQTMDERVVMHEPTLALFVPDEDPLKFYRAVASIAAQSLADDGTLYLEINPRFVDALTEMLRGFGFSDVRVEKYIDGLDRFIIARRK